MSDDGRITCPACRQGNGSIFRAFGRDDECPNCGLPAHVALEVIEFQQRHGRSELREQYDVAIARALTAEQQVAELKSRLREMREVANRPLPGVL